jgi:ATP adenylyltransferase
MKYRENGVNKNMKNTCRFCDPERIKEKVGENGTVFAIKDGFPVTPGHLLIIPHRHTTDYFTMTAQERHDAEDLIISLRNKITSEDPAVLGFNIGTNCGEIAGQSVMHAHIHLIPRRKGDTENPRGGVRGVIPGHKHH